MGLRAVLQYGKTGPIREIEDRLHVVQEPEEMRDHDRVEGSFLQDLLEVGEVHQPRTAVHVHEDRFRAECHQCGGRVAAGVRDRRHAAARADAERAKTEFDGVRSAGDAHAVGSAAVFGEFPLEGFALLAQDVPAAAQHPLDRSADDRLRQSRMTPEVVHQDLVSHVFPRCLDVLDAISLWISAPANGPAHPADRFFAGNGADQCSPSSRTR
nr:hypothetical protein [Microbispora sp. GKU 823]